jgi:hypothetical protein
MVVMDRVMRVDRRTLIVKEKRLIKERNHRTKHLGKMELRERRIKGHKTKGL